MTLIGTTFAPRVAVPSAPADPPPLVFDRVTVIDVEHGQRLADQRVVIVGNRIRAVGRAGAIPLPAGARVIHAQGKYLIPGLWDMHAHVDSNAPAFYPRFIASGVTGLREMAQRFPGGTDSFHVWQRQIAAGTRVGPRVVGPSVDVRYSRDRPLPTILMQALHKQDTQYGQGWLDTPDDARRLVDSAKAAGDAFVKQHSDRMPRNIYFALAAEARRVGIPLVGHLPVEITEIEASDSGQRSIEHAEENHHCWPDWSKPVDSALAEQRCAPVAAAYIRNGTWMVPTLAISYYIRPGIGVYPGGDSLEAAQRFVRMMHRLGVRRILAGTDVGMDTSWFVAPAFQPGISLLEEIVFLNEAGLSPLEALQAATLNPARFFNATDSLGTVAPGKLADVVLLDADPLTDIHNIRTIRAVVANGRYFDHPSPAVIAVQPGSDTETDSIVTTDVLARMTTFWTHFRQEPDSIQSAVVLWKESVIVLAGLRPRDMTAIDMEQIAAQYPSVATELAQAGLTTQQWESYRLALFDADAALHHDLIGWLPTGSVVARNGAFLRAHPQAIGLTQAMRDAVTAWGHTP